MWGNIGKPRFHRPGGFGAALRHPSVMHRIRRTGNDGPLARLNDAQWTVGRTIRETSVASPSMSTPPESLATVSTGVCFSMIASHFFRCS
jgi:hypothetical protein